MGIMENNGKTECGQRAGADGLALFEGKPAYRPGKRFHFHFMAKPGGPVTGSVIIEAYGNGIKKGRGGA